MMIAIYSPNGQPTGSVDIPNHIMTALEELKAVMARQTNDDLWQVMGLGLVDRHVQQARSTLARQMVELAHKVVEPAPANAARGQLQAINRDTARMWVAEAASMNNWPPARSVSDIARQVAENRRVAEQVAAMGQWQYVGPTSGFSSPQVVGMIHGPHLWGAPVTPDQPTICTRCGAASNDLSLSTECPVTQR